MKKFINGLFCLLILAFPSLSYAGPPAMQMILSGSTPAVGGAECDSYELVCQNFEGTGYDNSETWEESGSTVNEDYEGVVLRGSQSLLLDNAASGSPYIQVAEFTETDDMWAFFRIRFPGNLPDSNVTFFGLYAGTHESATLLVSISYRTLGVIRASDGSSTLDFNSPSADTTYYIWVNWIAATSGDGEVHFYCGTSETRPTEIGSGITNATQTDGGTFVRFMYADASTMDLVVDQVYASATEIGNVSP